MKASFVAKPLQRSQSRNRHSGRLLESEAFRFGSYVGFGSTRVFGEGASAGAEHRIARLEVSHGSPYGHHAARDIHAGPRALHAPVQRIDGSGADLHKDFVVFRNGLFEVHDPKDPSRSGLGIDGSLHMGSCQRRLAYFITRRAYQEVSLRSRLSGPRVAWSLRHDSATAVTRRVFSEV